MTYCADLGTTYIHITHSSSAGLVGEKVEVSVLDCFRVALRSCHVKNRFGCVCDGESLTLIFAVIHIHSRIENDKDRSSSRVGEGETDAFQSLYLVQNVW